MAPRCKTCRLVATTEAEGETLLTVLHSEDGFVYFNLTDIENQREDIQVYIKKLQPKILSGDYCAELIDMEKEEVCC